MNEDSAETSQIGMNFAAPKVVVTDRALIPWPENQGSLNGREEGCGFI